MVFYVKETPQVKESLFDLGWVWTSFYQAGDLNWSHPDRPNRTYTLEAALKLEKLPIEYTPCTRE